MSRSPVVLALLTLLTAGANGQANDTFTPGAARLRIGAGFGASSMSSGGASGSAAGLLVGLQASFVTSPRSDVSFEVLAQPFRVQNPNRDEAFRAYYFMLGVQAGGRTAERVYLRPALGLVYRPWTGTDVWVASETSVALGVAGGFEFEPSWHWPIALEVFVLGSGADELSTSLLGISLNTFTGARRAH